jgi:hypothetical protein
LRLSAPQSKIKRNRRTPAGRSRKRSCKPLYVGREKTRAY